MIAPTARPPMTPAAIAPPSRAKAGCDVAVTANANAEMAVSEMTFSMFYPFKVGC
jgi:hypothetical protein